MEIPEGDEFGPFGGQLLVADNNGKRITRVMIEKVGGAFQGACAHFYNENGIQLGNNRLAFSPDKSTLYVGQTSRGWGQIAEGLQRIIYTGETPFDVKRMTLTDTGFALEFTTDLGDNAVPASQFSMSRYRYEDTGEYGSGKHDASEVEIAAVRRTGSNVLELDIPKLEDGGWLYELRITPFRDARQVDLRTDLICYTVNRLRGQAAK